MSRAPRPPMRRWPAGDAPLADWARPVSAALAPRRFSPAPSSHGRRMGPRQLKLLERLRQKRPPAEGGEHG